jgi:tRNA-dihydrouridine synthase
MLTLHARFARQGFDGEADWRLISELREAISIPLIGNGDVKTPDDALRMLRETGCDGVMVGRAAISNPWALRNISDAMTGSPRSSQPALAERIRTALEHLRLMVDYEMRADPEQAELRACRALRGQMPLYIKGEVGAAQVRDRLTKCSTVAEYEDVLDAFASQAVTASR